MGDYSTSPSCPALSWRHWGHRSTKSNHRTSRIHRCMEPVTALFSLLLREISIRCFSNIFPKVLSPSPTLIISAQALSMVLAGPPSWLARGWLLPFKSWTAPHDEQLETQSQCSQPAWLVFPLCSLLPLCFLPLLWATPDVRAGQGPFSGMSSLRLPAPINRQAQRTLTGIPSRCP